MTANVYPLSAPEKVGKSGVPYIVYVSSPGVRTKSIGEGYHGGKEASIELNLVSGSYRVLKEMELDTIALLEGLECRKIGGSGPYIQELTYFDPAEMFESAPGLYRCSIDCNIFYEEDDQ